MPERGLYYNNISVILSHGGPSVLFQTFWPHIKDEQSRGVTFCRAYSRIFFYAVMQQIQHLIQYKFNYSVIRL